MELVKSYEDKSTKSTQWEKMWGGIWSFCYDYYYGGDTSSSLRRGCQSFQFFKDLYDSQGDMNPITGENLQMIELTYVYQGPLNV